MPAPQYSLGPHFFTQKPPWNKPNQVKGKLAPTTPSINYPAPRILRMDAGDGGAAGAVALATSAEKKTREKGVRDENLEEIRITSSQPPPSSSDRRGKRAGDRGRYPEGGARRRNPSQKARSGEAAVDRTKAVTAIKGGR